MSRSSQGDTADFLKRYTKDERTLGSGAYGVVYKATCMKTGETVALKKIKMEGTDEGIPGTALREISVLRTLKHPNIVHLRDVEPSKGRLYLVFEYCDHDLKHFMDAIPTRRLDKLLVKQLTFQLMVGLVYCHKRGIVHRDLKPQVRRCKQCAAEFVRRVACRRRCLLAQIAPTAFLRRSHRRTNNSRTLSPHPHPFLSNHRTCSSTAAAT